MKTLMFLSALGLMAAADDSSPPAGASSAKKDTSKKVKCRCLVASLGEDDKVYVKDEIFETTAARAAALGDSVEIQS